MKNKKCATGVKKVAVSKYAEGGTVEAPKKKMNIFGRLKKKEDESAALANSIDAQDDLDAGYKAPEAIQKAEIKTPSIGVSKSTYAPEKIKEVEVTKVKSDKPIGWNDEGEKERVIAYQKRHGLKADGVWNEGGETDKYYKAQLAAKSPKKMVIKKTVTPTSSNTVVATKPSGESGKYVKSPEFKGAAGDSSRFSKPDTTFPKQRTEEERYRAAARLEKQYGDEGGAFGTSDKTANELVDIEQKGNNSMLSTLGKVGLVGGLGTAAAIAIARRKGGKGSNRTSKAVGEAASEFAQEMGGKSKAVTKNVVKSSNTLSNAAGASTPRPKMQFNPSKGMVSSESPKSPLVKTTSKSPIASKPDTKSAIVRTTSTPDARTTKATGKSNTPSRYGADEVKAVKVEAPKVKNKGGRPKKTSALVKKK